MFCDVSETRERNDSLRAGQKASFPNGVLGRFWDAFGTLFGLCWNSRLPPCFLDWVGFSGRSGAPKTLAVLNMILFLSLAPGVPGEGPDCHFPKEIVGVGPTPARIRKCLILILALSTARKPEHKYEPNTHPLLPYLDRGDDHKVNSNVNKQDTEVRETTTEENDEARSDCENDTHTHTHTHTRSQSNQPAETDKTYNVVIWSPSCRCTEHREASPDGTTWRTRMGQT